MGLKNYLSRSSSVMLVIIGVAVCIGTVHPSDHCARLDKRANRCILQPETIEGPYYLNQRLVRQDIRESQPGVPFRLRLQFTHPDTCAPLKNIRADLWQANALGMYSGYIGFHGPVDANGHGQPIDNYRFLRGTQFSDANGFVDFITIFPGWYPGRTVHIHVIAYSGPNRIHTGQIYFTENLTQYIGQFNPYRQSRTRRVRNEEDQYFTSDNGAQSTIYNVNVANYNSTYPLLEAIMIIGLKQ
ncbi:uncharacterized protein LOC128952423 [Oppia nitens]|uniref:uncharacterized protein LOC128952423 n=1 Tax=Oppia nitens TaxID=1686743 RepID=UPI0023DB10EA|nr:uncharacterized protein LOC128952423 [Oppia nitens]